MCSKLHYSNAHVFIFIHFLNQLNFSIGPYNRVRNAKLDLKLTLVFELALLIMFLDKKIVYFN